MTLDDVAHFADDDFDSGVIGLFKRKNDNQTSITKISFDDNVTNKSNKY